MANDIVTSRLTPYGENNGNIEFAGRPYHDFWLLRDEDTEYMEYVGRKDAPVRLSDDIFSYISETLSWVPTTHPSNNEKWRGYGLNHFGPTRINADGGQALTEVCTGWIQIFTHAPEMMVLTRGMYLIHGEEPPRFRWHRFKVYRAELIKDLTLLSEFGRRTKSGEWYILHLGI